MYKDNIDFKAINNKVINHSHSFLSQILPNGERRGNQWVALNPTRNDRKLGSFTINLRTGIWKDYATNDKGGDLISLVAYVFNLSQLDAAKELAKLFSNK